jgi:hypothetical protein
MIDTAVLEAIDNDAYEPFSSDSASCNRSAQIIRDSIMSYMRVGFCLSSAKKSIAATINEVYNLMANAAL